MIAYCGHCGLQITVNEIHCPRCGTSTNAGTESTMISDGSVTLSNDLQLLYELPIGQFAYNVSYSPTGQLIACIGSKLIVIDAVSLKEVWQIPAYSRCFIWSPDGTRIAMFNNSHDQRDQAEKGLRIRLTNNGQLLEWMINEPIYSNCAWSKNGQLIACIVRRWGTDLFCDLWNLRNRSNKPETSFRVNPEFQSICFDSQNNVILGSNDGKIRFDPSKLIKKITRSYHSGKITFLECSPDGLKLASASEDGTIGLWDIVSRQILTSFTGHVGKVYQACWSPDSRYIVSASEDQTIRVWDTLTYKQKAIGQTSKNGDKNMLIQQHTQYKVNYIARFSPDGQKIISNSEDQTIRIWDARSIYI